MASSRRLDRADWYIALALASTSVALYAPLCQAEFINYDDPGYITENHGIRAGITPASVLWDITTLHRSNWHPLTWLSLQLDYEFYDLRAAGYHLTNVLLHAASTVLLFSVLCFMTGARWCSAMVAALFAWHPLHVESVAWAAERKDVLSGFFFMLTLCTYVRYVQSRETRRWIANYLFVLVAFGLGLLSKPMLVTLPCVLLLLDYWPLGRWQPGGRWRPVFEKLPLFLMSAASSVITVLAQRHGGALRTLNSLGPEMRAGNAAWAYFQYLLKACWPTTLGIFYPFESSSLIFINVVAAILMLTTCTLIALKLARPYPFLLVGWFWFLGMLVPVIGLVQVGDQAMADRYTYLPLIGLFISLVWATAALVDRLQLPAVVPALLGSVVLAACCFFTESQIAHWQNSIALWTNSLKATPENATSHWLLGAALIDRGFTADGRQHLERALTLDPQQPEAHYNLGLVLERQGQERQAMEHYLHTLSSNPDHWQAHVHLGLLLWKQGDLESARRELETAAQLEPRLSHAHTWLGKLCSESGDLQDAAAQYAIALRLNPRSATCHNDLGVLLSRQGQLESAVQLYNQAVQIDPSYADAFSNLGIDLARLGRFPEACAAFDRAMALKPDVSAYRCHHAFALQGMGNREAALAEYSGALRHDPGWTEAANQTAWTLATDPDPRLRDGEDAVLLASEVCQATEERRPEYLDTLAAALAETGRFAEAAKTARKALELAQRMKPQLAQAINERLHLYEGKMSYHAN
jgi:tetratricopeptide (TPR) repeat protein